MFTLNLIEIYDLFEHKTNGSASIIVIQQLQSWNLIASNNQLGCRNDHFFKLSSDSRFSDEFSWRCWETYKDSNKKGSKM